MTIAKEMNRDLRKWLLASEAPTGTWRVDGGAVSYPPDDMVSYSIPDQTGLKPLKKNKKKSKH
jgi:hypothetical protein